MTQTSLSGIKLAAALAEEAYRRNLKAQSINVFQDLGMELPPGLPELIGTTLALRDGYYYPIDDANPDKGFVGRILKKTVGGVDTYYVIYRGTDSSEDVLRSIVAPDSQKTDAGDSDSNRRLAFGTFAPSQLEAALALAQAAIDMAGASNVVLVGQSMGGGLEEIVSRASFPADTARRQAPPSPSFALGLRPGVPRRARRPSIASIASRKRSLPSA